MRGEALVRVGSAGDCAQRRRDGGVYERGELHRREGWGESLRAQSRKRTGSGIHTQVNGSNGSGKVRT